MLTITWTYERPTDEYPFYPETSEGAAFQAIIEQIGKDSKLVIERKISTTEDGLTRVSTYGYESVADCLEFTAAINLSIPTFFPSRNAYLLRYDHKLIGVANQPTFLSQNKTQLEMIVVIP